MKTYFLKFAVLLTVVAFIGGCNSATQTESTSAAAPKSHPLGQASVVDGESDLNILQVAIGSDAHKTLVAAVQATKIEHILVNAGPLTVFAPTDDAFAKLPEGTGTLVGVYSTFNGTKQLTIRDIKDVINFKVVPVIPQSVPFVETFDSLSTNWTIFSVASNKNWLFSAADKAMSANGYGGDIASDDYLITPPVKLSNFSNYNLSFTSWTKYI